MPRHGIILVEVKERPPQLKVEKPKKGQNNMKVAPPPFQASRKSTESLPEAFEEDIDREQQEFEQSVERDRRDR